MARCATALRGAGLSFADVVLVHVCLGNMDCFPALNKAFLQAFPTQPPARVCVASCAPPGFMDIEAVAVRASDNEIVRTHVQSVSHWAPANIGPYSQAVQIGPLLLLAGQIGLWPGTMTMLAGPDEQSAVSLQSVSRVLAVHAAGPDRVDAVVAFVTAPDMMSQACAAASAFASRAEVIVVCVPALPRGAVIEWQVVCTQARGESPGTEGGDGEEEEPKSESESRTHAVATAVWATPPTPADLARLVPPGHAPISMRVFLSRELESHIAALRPAATVTLVAAVHGGVAAAIAITART